MSFIECVKEDLKRKVVSVSLASFFCEYFAFQGMCFRVVFWLRVVQFAKKHRISRYFIGYPAMLILRSKEKRLGIYINTNISIGKGLSIVHPGGIFINAESIGDNFTILQNVTIGSKPGTVGLPKIGDNVSIFVGSVVCGNITVGDHTIIGANSYVSSDLPPNSKVYGPRSAIK